MRLGKGGGGGEEHLVHCEPIVSITHHPSPPRDAGHLVQAIAANAVHNVVDAPLTADVLDCRMCCRDRHGQTGHMDQPSMQMDGNAMAISSHEHASQTSAQADMIIRALMRPVP